MSKRFSLLEMAACSLEFLGRCRMIISDRHFLRLILVVGVCGALSVEGILDVLDLGVLIQELSIVLFR